MAAIIKVTGLYFSHVSSIRGYYSCSASWKYVCLLVEDSLLITLPIPKKKAHTLYFVQPPFDYSTHSQCYHFNKLLQCLMY